MDRPTRDRKKAVRYSPKRGEKREEKRAASDGTKYTKQEFIDHYGKSTGTKKWNAAGKRKTTKGKKKSPKKTEKAKTKKAKTKKAQSYRSRAQFIERAQLKKRLEARRTAPDYQEKLDNVMQQYRAIHSSRPSVVDQPYRDLEWALPLRRDDRFDDGTTSYTLGRYIQQQHPEHKFYIFPPYARWQWEQLYPDNWRDMWQLVDSRSRTGEGRIDEETWYDFIVWKKMADSPFNNNEGYFVEPDDWFEYLRQRR